MKPTDVQNPEYYHKVVDCQYACPAHTPVPHYIRLIAAGKYTEAYMVNWESNVFPGILGRTCDRPCEPACRRGRVEEEPVAICRLKRVAADFKDDISQYIPEIPEQKNGKKVAIIGAGPAGLTVARDLAPLGYEIHIYDDHSKGGGMMRTQIPSFRLPDEVLDSEVDLILNMGIVKHFNNYVTSLKEMLEKKYDAVFVASGAPKGKDLPDLPGRWDAKANIHVGIEWLANVTFEHISKIGRKVLVLGGGNTAMDCCRTSRRLGGDEVKVLVRSPFKTMKASPWEIEDAMHEDIPIFENHVPKSFVTENGKLKGMYFELVKAEYDAKGKRTLVPTGEPNAFFEADDVIIAIGQDNRFEWIENDLGLEFDKWGLPVLDENTLSSTIPGVFFGGDAAFGPKNVITAVAQGHQAAISIDLYCQGKSLNERPLPHVNLMSTKMGIHEWSYGNDINHDQRFIVPMADKKLTLSNLKKEVELGFDLDTALKEAERCLNCDIQTVFTEDKCIECDACRDICPTKCINFIDNEEEESALRNKLIIPAINDSQDILVSDILKTGRVMVKDEDVCLHCGLCAERCPTAAWDMKKFIYKTAKAGVSA
ncbi:MAG: FAD-dependent oxidoreductase [Cytophagaceae bacterium]|nr:FAD-dependent oxidoreductase [Cytophagaceae bacterium]